MWLLRGRGGVKLRFLSLARLRRLVWRKARVGRRRSRRLCCAIYNVANGAVCCDEGSFAC